MCAIQGQDTSVRDTLSEGCIVEGKQIPRDLSFKKTYGNGTYGDESS